MCNAWFLCLFPTYLCFIDCMSHVLFTACAFTDSVEASWSFCRVWINKWIKCHLLKHSATDMCILCGWIIVSSALTCFTVVCVCDLFHVLVLLEHTWWWTVNIWNSLPNTVVEVDTVDKFKFLLDKFWMYQDIKYDFTAELTGTGDRSECDSGNYY